MTRPLLDVWRGVRCPVVGMLHLPALPGSPGSGLAITEIGDVAVRNAEAWAAGGADGLMLENFGDVPFHAGRVEAHVVAAMTAIACRVRAATDLPLGINVLRNDGRSALAVALASNAQFIRVNVLCGARLTDQGILEGIAADLMRDRARLGATHIKVMADVDVKHSAPLAPMRLEDEVHDTIVRGLADAIIVSGRGTGHPVDAGQLQQAKAAAGDVPVWIGSGVTPENVKALMDGHGQGAGCDGVIVGTSVKRGGVVHGPVDPALVRALIERCHG